MGILVMVGLLSDLDGLIQGKEDDIGKLFGEDRLAPQVPGPQVPESPRSWSSGVLKSFTRTFRNGVSILKTNILVYYLVVGIG